MSNCKTEVAGPAEVAMMGMLGPDLDVHDCAKAIGNLARKIDALSMLQEMKVSVLSLKPGDTLILKHPKRLSDLACDHIKTSVQQKFGCECLILEEGMDVVEVAKGGA